MLKELIKSIFIYGIAGSISSLIGFFLLPIYTRTFSPTEYGSIEVINTIIMFAGILGMLQLESAIARFFYQSEEIKRKKMISSAFWAIIIFSFIAVVILIISADIISGMLFKDESHSVLIRVAALIVPLSNMYLFFSVIMRFIKKPVQFTLFMIVQLVSSLGFAIYFVVYLKAGIIGAFYGKIAGFLCTDVIMVVYLRKYLKMVIDLQYLKEMLKYSVPLVPASGGAWINSYASRLIMVAYLSMNDIGLYSVAFKIASLFTLFERAFKMAWNPFMWEHINRKDHREIFKNIANVLFITVFAIIIIVALFSKEMLVIFTSKEYLSANNFIGIILLSFGMRMINQVIGMGAGIIKKTKYNTLSFFISVGIHLLCLFIAIPRLGLIAVPLSLFAANFSLNMASWFISEKLYYIGFNKFIYFLCLSVALLLVFVMKAMQIHIVIKISVSVLIIAGLLRMLVYTIKQYE